VIRANSRRRGAAAVFGADWYAGSFAVIAGITGNYVPPDQDKFAVGPWWIVGDRRHTAL